MATVPSLREPHQDQVDRAVRCHDRALRLIERGDYDRARLLSERALQAINALLGPQSPDAVNVAGTLGDIYEALGLY